MLINKGILVHLLPGIDYIWIQNYTSTEFVDGDGETKNKIQVTSVNAKPRGHPMGETNT